MVQTYVSGQWEQVTVRGSGPLELVLSSVERAELVVSDAAGPVRRLGRDGADLVLPPGSVGGQRPVTVSVRSLSGQAFGGGATVDLAVEARQTGESYLLRANPVAGKTDAVVMQMLAVDGGVILRPAEGGSATRGLGGWCVRRLEEQGYTPAMTIRTVLVDVSRSMERYGDEVDAVMRFLEDMAQTLALTPPVRRDVPVAGAPVSGVGFLAVPAQVDWSSTILVTDLPAAGVPHQLLLCDPALLQALPAPGALALSGAAWKELTRSDSAFDSRTLDALAGLLAWLGAGSLTGGKA